jgi:hypothetical protein
MQLIKNIIFLFFLHLTNFSVPSIAELQPISVV